MIYNSFAVCMHEYFECENFKDLKNNSKLILFFLLSIADNKTHICYQCSHKSYVEKVGKMGKNQYSSSLKELCEKGFITKIESGNSFGKCNRYKINRSGLWPKDKEKKNKQIEKNKAFKKPVEEHKQISTKFFKNNDDLLSKTVEIFSENPLFENANHNHFQNIQVFEYLNKRVNIHLKEKSFESLLCEFFKMSAYHQNKWLNDDIDCRLQEKLDKCLNFEIDSVTELNNILKEFIVNNNEENNQNVIEYLHSIYLNMFHSDVIEKVVPYKV